MSEEKHSEWLEVAERVAKQAGGYLKNEGSRKVNFQDDRDVKLQADEDSEVMIREVLEKETGLSIIGEEQGGDEDLLERSEYFWVIDPLDGTYNYLRGQAQTCVSIGLMRGSDHVLGVIYDFTSDEMYSGIAGGGLQLNGEGVEPAWAEDLGKACLMTGFPAGCDLSTEALSGFVEEVQRFKKIRMIGSAALALATVAVGRADAYFEESTRLWDFAAGAALVLAGGGRVKITRLKGDGLRHNVWAVGKEEWFN